jgi:Na+-transporting methylmalonyl-CoA/oxaloacetate decarboxylase gamma subunit
MNNLTMSLDNIFATNAFTISIMGILIVFSALMIIALFTALLPKLLPFLEKLLPEKHHAYESSPSETPDHEKVLAAIAYALFRKETGSLPGK